MDANYRPGTRTPVTALMVALGHLAGATSVYAEDRLAAFLPAGLGYDVDVLRRAERYLREVPRDQFLAEVAALRSWHQKLVVAVQLLAR